MPLESQLCFALYASSLAMTKAYRPLLAAIGMTYPQYLVMLVLWQTDDQSIGALCAALALDSGTLTPLLKRMEQAGMLDRVRDTVDERRVVVSLTHTGRALQQKAAAIQAQVACATSMTRDSARELIATLAELRTSLDACATG